MRSFARFAVLLLACPLLAQPARGSTTVDWPVYGADLANSRTVPGGPSATAVPTLRVAWRLDVGDGDFTGTPVESGGLVYVGSNGGVVRAIDAASGRVRWTARVAGPVDGSLAVDDGSVFVPVARRGAPELAALRTTTGRSEWATVLDTSTDATVFGSPVPVQAGGHLVVLQGVSATSGDPPSPLRGSLSELDGVTGARRWKTYTVPPGFNGGAVWSTPAVDLSTGTVYVGTGNAYSGTAAPTTDAILAVRLDDGAVRGSFQGTAGDVFSSSAPGLDFDFGASPNLLSVDGHTVVGEGQKSGTYWALDATKMRPVWHTTVGAGSVLGGVLGSTAYDRAAGAVIGPLSVPGYLWSLSGARGTPNWVGTGGVDAAHLSPVAVSNGVVYSVASTGFLEAWLEATGTPLVALPLNAVPPTGGYNPALGSGVSIAGGRVFADTGTGNMTGSVVAFTRS